LAVPANAVGVRPVRFKINRRHFAVKRVSKVAKNYSEVAIALAMVIAGAILASLASYHKRRYGNNDELELMAELDETLRLGQAFPEPVSTGQAHVDEPVDIYASYRNARRPDLDAPTEEDDGFSTESDDDDSDVSDGMAAPEYH
jgi:hypothetical protein